ncbi:MAG: histidine kinase, partial [Clostridiales bacterium]|nr:histidine kinase [Clostridiales bacterium]
NQSFEQAVNLEKAELNRLYLQVHPHFLYNCLFNISNLCTTGDYENVGRFIRLLGAYYRYITYGSEKIVTMAEEYEYMSQYVQMQGLRFGSRISVDLAPLPAWARDVRVPKFILQPVVENAYKHGCEVNLESGLIRVSFAGEDGYVCVYVEDNGKNFTDGALRALRERFENALPDDGGAEGGLINIHRRLALYCRGKSGLSAERSPLGGAKIIIRFLCGAS